MVIKWATAEGHRHDNPAGPQIITALPRRPQNSEHHPALPFAEVGKAIKRIRDTNAWWSTKLCMEFVALTAVRSGEARLARWDEIDEEHLIWTIPASRMRRNLEHKVPLSNAAMTVLSQARDLKYPTVSGDLLDPGMTVLSHRAGSGDLLDPGTCWIRGLAGSGDLLDPGTCWIRGLAGSWIRGLAGSGDLLDPGTCWIRGLAGGLVFPSPTGRALTGNTVSKLLRDNKIGCVPHGMRSGFVDWVAECTDAPKEIAGHALHRGGS